MKDIKEQLKENWKIIAKYSNDPLSKDAEELKLINELLITKLNNTQIVPLDYEKIMEMILNEEM